MTEKLNARTAPTAYILFMAAWIYGFADANWDLPTPVSVMLLILPAFVHVGLGYVIGRWEAVALAGVPVVIAVAAAGIGSVLWVSLALLMIFPGAPLIAGGVFLREWLRTREEDPAESWLYF